MALSTSLESLQRRIRVARGHEAADLLFVNGRIISTFTGEVLELPVAIAEGRVVSLGGSHAASEIVDLEGAYLAPAFTDAHIHVESSLLTPEGFAETVVPHGTGCTVSDPHEIVNVLGLDGLAYMERASRGLPLDILYTIPSCVPATLLETSGAELGPAEVAAAFDQFPSAPALSELMNFPGVLFGLREVLEKALEARRRNLLVDGHSPALSGPDLDGYLNAGVATDHECMTPEEAAEKLRRGMLVFLREGSAAKNLRALIPAITPFNANRVCIVSDDRHPEDLLEQGHLDAALRTAVACGLDPMTALRAVTLNPAMVYGFRDRGGIAPGYLADLVVLDNLRDFSVRSVYHKGQLVAQEGALLHPIPRRESTGTMGSVRLPENLEGRLADFPASGAVRVIGVEPDQILTRSERGDASEAGPGKTLQFAAVVERHRGTGAVGLGMVRGFDMRCGALASTVSHDSHNLVVVGASPAEMALAATAVQAMGGGLAAVRGKEVVARLPLPVAGLMSTGKAAEVATALRDLHAAARSLGCPLPAPFMTLAFLALPVIPHLKLTDQGLVDVDFFKIVALTLE